MYILRTYLVFHRPTDSKVIFKLICLWRIEIFVKSLGFRVMIVWKTQFYRNILQIFWHNRIVMYTDKWTSRENFFSKIRKFWAWADKLGWNFMRHLGYFWPNYQHYFGTVGPLSIGKCSWFPFLQKTLFFRSKRYNSQMLPK